VVYRREQLDPASLVEGPAIIAEMAATTWVAPGWRARADEWGNLRLCREQSRKKA